MSCRVLKAQSDHRSRHEGESALRNDLSSPTRSVVWRLRQNKPDDGENHLFADGGRLFFPPVTHYSMWLLVSWAHCSSTVKSSLADSEHLHDWLKKLTLLIPEVSLSQHQLAPGPGLCQPGRKPVQYADVDKRSKTDCCLLFICVSGSFNPFLL